ncbi:uncharacterized protein LOC115033348 [Acyrthosiphon pisum]|uniref:Uncharacterized protein n=1 Tax=Acyrthosiphon pisum TaxID=7029 RepID=A0A8R2NJV9_ACYPI|nr:uncharacterized protein LOC115033348 [Acyrthosiphon pisum]
MNLLSLNSYFGHFIKGSIDIPPTVKELDDKDPNRPRSPETFLGGSGVQADVLVKRSEHSLKANLVETVPEMDINVPEKENDEDRQISSEDSEENSDDDIVMAAGNFTLSSINNYMASFSQQNNASSSNLKRNNLLKLTNIPGMSSGNKHQGKFNAEDLKVLTP